MLFLRLKNATLFVSITYFAFLVFPHLTSGAQMAALYNLADAYVTPYHAEAFNMPALEAAACGVPLIVPRGGPTDDFVYAPSTVFIPTMVEELHEHNQVGSRGGWHYFQNMVSQYSFT